MGLLDFLKTDKLRQHASHRNPKANQKLILNPWRTVSATTCMNISETCMGQFYASDQLADLKYPAWCALYISMNWGRVWYSQRYKAEDFASYVSADVEHISNHLLSDLDVTRARIVEGKSLGMCGSQAFTSLVFDAAKTTFDKQLASEAMTAMTFFQQLWEIQFWFVQGCNSREQVALLNVINDFGDHGLVFDRTIGLINGFGEKGQGRQVPILSL